jgi:hypothetical protein
LIANEIMRSKNDPIYFIEKYCLEESETLPQKLKDAINAFYLSGESLFVRNRIIEWFSEKAIIEKYKTKPKKDKIGLLEKALQQEEHCLAHLK